MYSLNIDLILKAMTIIAFILSVCTFVQQLIINHINLVFELVDVYQWATPDKCEYAVRVIITNKSRIPISVTKIAANCRGSSLTFLQVSRTLCSHKKTRGSVIVSEYSINSDEFPLCLQGLDSRMALFSASSKDGLVVLRENEPIKFIASTSRGRVTKELIFSDFSDTKQL